MATLRIDTCGLKRGKNHSKRLILHAAVIHRVSRGEPILVCRGAVVGSRVPKVVGMVLILKRSLMLSAE